MDRFVARQRHGRPIQGAWVEVGRCTRAPVAVVWNVLADAHSFATWVSGTRRIRAADPGWPSTGTRLWHQWGPWPLAVRDSTEVIECEPPYHLELCARVRMLAVVRVVVRLERADDRTRVVLCEQVEGGVAAWTPALTKRIQAWRNRRSLDRLVALAEAASG
jgi:uncharacterized protein YndB with AHSA1/START domain